MRSRGERDGQGLRGFAAVEMYTAGERVSCRCFVLFYCVGTHVVTWRLKGCESNTKYRNPWKFDFYAVVHTRTGCVVITAHIACSDYFP